MITNALIVTALLQISTISGQIRDVRSHTPVASARVELLGAGGLFDVQYSDDDGHFQFSDVADNGYFVSVILAGYDTTTVRLDRVRGVSRIEINLTPIGEPPAGKPIVVSAREYMAPAAAKKLFEHGRKEMQKDCTKAILDFQNGLRIFDEDALAHNDLGNCYKRTGNLQDAESHFLRALSLDDSPYIAMNLADVYSAQRKYPEAETVLSNAIRKTPQNGDVYYALAAVYFWHGRIEDAERTALQADSRIHNIADLHLLLAKIYDREQNQQKAVEQLRQYVKEAPDGEVSKRIRNVLKKK
jgi:Tfp pilus assembly protein PilF